MERAELDRRLAKPGRRQVTDLRASASKYQPKPLPADSEEFRAVIERHQNLFAHRRLLRELDTDLRWQALAYVIWGRE